MHLVGSARTRRMGEVTELRPPRGGSLLRFFWPVVAADFERALAARGSAEEATRAGRPRLTAPALMRLPLAWTAPAPQALPRAPALRILGEAQSSVRPDFDWAGAIATAVGEVVHFELHRLARTGQPREALAARTGAWSRLLREAGVDQAHLPEALARTQEAIGGLLRSDLAGQLLDPRTSDAASELAVTARIAGVVQSLRIDRTFVDEAGVRWIVDWKTSRHEGGDREAFLDQELERYRGQLERYAQAMRTLEPGRPMKTGLYFPLLDAWRGI
jgi:ATP-dependent exoDNAse (exonuclease V) beta subunit